jgi:beta-lactamase regulating signal transducer with metallopeptidase domain
MMFPILQNISLQALSLQSLAQIFAERQLNAAAAGIVLAVLVGVLLCVIRRQNSGTRFAIWFSALLAIVVFPFLSFFHNSQTSPIASPPGEIVLNASWASNLFAAWGVIAGLLLVRLAVGFWRMRTIRRNCTEIDANSLDPAIAGILGTFAARRQVRLCTSDELVVPAALGLFRPAIVFPAALLPQLSAHEIEMIVRHELAHLNRWDDWTNLAQKVVKAVFFFHPAVWWIENRLTLEREMACDDIVLTQTASPKAYASSLISFAEKLHSARGLALAQALVSRMHQMSLRVAQILDDKRPQRTGIWKPAIGLSAGLLALVIGAAPYMPRLVAFEDPGNGVHSSLTAQADAQLTNRTGAAFGDSMVQPVTRRQNFVPQPRAIAASYHAATMHSFKTRRVKAQLKTPVEARVKASHKANQVPSPMVMRASAVEEEPAAPKFYVLRTTEYEVSSPTGQSIWTLCIWKVDANNPADRQLESAIVVSWI